MHPAMVKRMFSLSSPQSPFSQGIVKYSATAGDDEAKESFLHLIRCSGFSTRGLYSQITDGGSQGMELAILGICGHMSSERRPLLVIDPTYSNYLSMAERTERQIVAVSRHLEKNGKFTVPPLPVIEKAIVDSHASALLVIPYDNPTGQFFPQSLLNDLGRLCVKYNLWMLSDEAYRELFYIDDQPSSVWGITENEVPGISGRRISVESASKIWNACGLRIGALVTDNKEFHEQSVAENTANLCPNVIGQYLVAALLHESKESIHSWFELQRAYYRQMVLQITSGLKKELPQLIVSAPDAALYTVIDVRNMVGPNFDTQKFVLYCAQEGAVTINDVKKTLLVAPMTGFYSPLPGQPNLGKTQMRIAYVEPPEVMAEVPQLFAQLFRDFCAREQLSPPSAH
jgi:aspartate aminotransferase